MNPVKGVRITVVLADAQQLTRVGPCAALLLQHGASGICSYRRILANPPI